MPAIKWSGEIGNRGFVKKNKTIRIGSIFNYTSPSFMHKFRHRLLHDGKLADSLLPDQLAPIEVQTM